MNKQSDLINDSTAKDQLINELSQSTELLSVEKTESVQADSIDQTGFDLDVHDYTQGLDDSITSQIDSTQSSSSTQLVSDPLSTNDQFIKQVAFDAPATNDLKPDHTLTAEAIASQLNPIVVNSSSTTVTSITTDLIDSTNPDILAEKHTLLESNKDSISLDSTDTAASEVSELKNHLPGLISEETFEQQEKEVLNLYVTDLPEDTPNAAIENSVLSPVIVSETKNDIDTMAADEVPESREDGATDTVSESALAEPLTVNAPDAVPVEESLHSTAEPSAKPKLEAATGDSNVKVADAQAVVSAVESESFSNSSEINQEPTEIPELSTLAVNNNNNETAISEPCVAEPATVEPSTGEPSADVLTTTKPAGSQLAATEVDVAAQATADLTESEPAVADSVTSEPASAEPVASEAGAIEREITEPATEHTFAEPAATEDAVSENAIIEKTAVAEAASEAAVAEAAVAEAVAEAVVAEPAASESAVAEAVVAEPAFEPAVSEPVVAEPAVSEAAVSEAAVSEAAVAEPATAEPAVS
ncbi:hypothetical protein D0Z00_004598, partial [Geotrichum galactomycetum]